jgi:hypothetical protein
MKWWKVFMIAALMLLPAAGIVGCEVDADADDDKASLEIDTD